MPDYRKKKRNRLFSFNKPSKPKKTVKSASSDIEMTPEKKSRKTTDAADMRVVKGKKQVRKNRTKGWLAVLSAVCIVVIILEMVLPAGIARTLSNAVAVIGTGNFPIELKSSETLSVESSGSYFYVLSDTELYAYSNSGKSLYSYTHGFEKPVLKISKYGALLINQGDKTILIFDLKGLKKTISTKHSIINAHIADSGAYAIITRAEGYASTVSVYSKYGKTLYEWYSSKDTVNNAIISPNNKKIAVSTFNVENGEYHSKVSVLGFKSATPDFTVEYSNNPVYNLDSKGLGRFSVTTSKGIDFIKWSKNEKTEYKNEYNSALLRKNSQGSAVVFSRESDPTDNKLAVFSKNGKLKYQFDFNGVISDIALFGGHIYCMSDTEIYMLDESGNILKKATCGFGGIRITVIGANTILVVTDNKIEKIRLTDVKADMPQKEKK